MMGVGAKRALGLYRSCAPRHQLAGETAPKGSNPFANISLAH